jgi:hypothetical protein
VDELEPRPRRHQLHRGSTDADRSRRPLMPTNVRYRSTNRRNDER